MKPPRIAQSRRANNARLLRFAPALRVTERCAPVAGQLWPKGKLSAIAADRSSNTNRPAFAGQCSTTTGQITCYENRTT